MSKAPMRRFASELKKSLPGAQVVPDPPGLPGGIWFLDVSYRGRVAVVQWQARRGFGLTRTEDPIFGEGCHEVYSDPVATARRVAELLFMNAYTSDPTEAPIAGLRLLRGLSQQALAKRLHVQQAAVSKLERKSNIGVRTLQRVVHALGARLVLRVEWGDKSIEVNQFGPPTRPRKRKGHP